jgi:hypothetical protein
MTMPGPTDSQGNNFVFAGATYTATNVGVTYGGDLLETSHIGLASGASRTYISPALIDNEIAVDYLGTTLVSIGASGSLSFGGTTYTATCSASSLTYAVGELVKGNATFKVK